ncbi:MULTISPECIES: hypothetical protein [Rhizobium]|uniref:hypothetical protein n=1 Tax=Rhizobium TaxID=379 RepID=UPI0003F6AA2C|nr:MULTISPECIES: hypothetical protein [Rhizobium]UFS81546.1 hypothetical protein LPB79_25070 [Rhizobium sp. T136]
MNAIRWEQDVIDGALVDVWGGWMGRLNVCEARLLDNGWWRLRFYRSYPGSGGRDNWFADFESLESAQWIAEEGVHAWLDLRGLQTKGEAA